MRKVLAVVAGLVLLGTPCALAPLASAHDGHASWFKWREPEEGADVTGETVALRAKVAFEEGVDRWVLEVLPPDGYATLPAWGTVCEGAEEKHHTVEIACDWNSTAYPDGKPSRNHAYRLRVTAWNDAGTSSTTQGQSERDGEGGGSGGEEERARAESGEGGGGGDAGDGAGGGGTGDESTTTSSEPTTTTSTAPTTTSSTSPPPAGSEAHRSETRTVVVANPPAPPEGVKLDFAEKTSEVTITWNPNPEPDIAGYLVQERFGSGEWALVAKPSSTTWTGKLEKKGTYRFRVAAVRYVGSAERVQEGPYREPQTGMRKVEADPEDSGEKTDEESESDGKRKDQDNAAESTTSTAPGPEAIAAASAAPTDPAAPTSTTAATGAAQGSGLPSGVSPIAPGSPGSVQTRYADPPKLAGPVAPQQAYDPGFSLALPYPKEVRLDIGPPPEPPPRLLGTVVLFDSHEDQRRALVGVLAGALLVFIVSMQAAHLTHRPRPIDLEASTDWDDLGHR